MTEDKAVLILADMLKSCLLQCRGNMFPCIDYPNEDPCPECRVRQDAYALMDTLRQTGK